MDYNTQRKDPEEVYRRMTHKSTCPCLPPFSVQKCTCTPQDRIPMLNHIIGSFVASQADRDKAARELKIFGR